MPTYTQQQIENVWFALNLNRLKPNNDANSGAGLHNPNGSINMYKWLQDALMLLGGTGSGMNDNIYNADGTLTDNRTLSFSTDKTLTFSSTSTPFTTTLWTSNAFTQTIGKLVGTVDLDTRSQISNVGVGVVKTSGLNAQIYKSGDLNIANIAVSAVGSGFGNVRAIMEIENRIDDNNIFFELYSQVNGAYPWAKLIIPTNYQYGEGVDVLDYMVPSKVPTLNNELRYTYPLQQHAFCFGDSNSIPVLNQHAVGTLSTDSSGYARTAVQALISAMTYSVGVGTVRITVTEATSGSIFYSGTIDMSTLTGTGGTMLEAPITLPLNLNERYYASVTALSGVAAGIKGLTLTISTI